MSDPSLIVRRTAIKVEGQSMSHEDLRKVIAAAASKARIQYLEFKRRVSDELKAKGKWITSEVIMRLED